MEPRVTSAPIQFETSDDLTACLNSVKCVSLLSERYVHMRVLWELQNHLRCDDGLAPDSQEAMILCALSFPALVMDVIETPRAQKGSRIMERRGECSIDLYMRKEPTIEHYGYSIRASCGPQKLSVIVSFKSMEGTKNKLMSVHIQPNVNVTAKTKKKTKSAYGPRKEYAFDWESWRDSFHARLEGSRVWQQKLGLVNSPLLRTKHSINSGILKMQRSTTGTGSVMKVWKGWIPPRTSICMYEMTTPSFIMQAERTESVAVHVPMGKNMFVTFDVPQEILTHVAYENADPLSLKQASFVAQEFMRIVADGEDPERMGLSRAIMRAQKLIRNNVNRDDVVALLLLAVAGADASVEGLHEALVLAEKLIRNAGKSESSLALLLLELAAVRLGELGDSLALEKVMNLLMEYSCPANCIMRGLRFLERFYISKEKEADPEGWTPNKIYRFLGNDERVEVMLSLFEKLLAESNYEHFVAQRYMRFILLLSHYRKTDVQEIASMVMFKSLIFRGHLRETTKAAFAICDFSKVLSAAREEIAVKHLACSNLMDETGIAIDDNFPGYSVNRWKRAKAEIMRSLGVSIRHLSKKKEGMEILRCLKLNQKSIAEGRAMYELAVLKEQENIQEAVDFYNAAIDVGLHAPSMNRLAFLFMTGAHGIVVDIPRAIHLFTRAIQADRDVNAMKHLGQGWNKCIGIAIYCNTQFQSCIGVASKIA